MLRLRREELPARDWYQCCDPLTRTAAEERGSAINVEKAVILFACANLVTDDLAHQVFKGQCEASLDWLVPGLRGYGPPSLGRS
jgi:hypothetical protein